MPRKVFFDHTFIGIGAVFEQRSDPHQDATDAITALTGLLFHEGGQHGLAHLVIHQALGSLNTTPLAGPKRRCTGILCLIVDQHSASTTLPTTATKSD
jgi:hypothetical protein